ASKLRPKKHSPNPDHIRDIAYGPLKVRNLRQDPRTENDAVHNADSYMWFALVREVDCANKGNELFPPAA
ncbi:MAG: hypothetical protein Q9216_005574, partial [Gyalolechia sp. 2 TL-2023]